MTSRASPWPTSMAVTASTPAGWPRGAARRHRDDHQDRRRRPPIPTRRDHERRGATTATVAAAAPTSPTGAGQRQHRSDVAVLGHGQHHGQWRTGHRHERSAQARRTPAQRPRRPRPRATPRRPPAPPPCSPGWRPAARRRCLRPARARPSPGHRAWQPAAARPARGTQFGSRCSTTGASTSTPNVASTDSVRPSDPAAAGSASSNTMTATANAWSAARGRPTMVAPITTTAITAARSTDGSARVVTVNTRIEATTQSRRSRAGASCCQRQDHTSDQRDVRTRHGDQVRQSGRLHGVLALLGQQAGVSGDQPDGQTCGVTVESCLRRGPNAPAHGFDRARARRRVPTPPATTVGCRATTACRRRR